MFQTSKGGFVVIVAATATLILLSGSATQAAQNNDKAHGSSAAATSDDRAAPDGAVTITVVSSPAATAALTTIQARIARYVAKNGTGYTFGSYLDATTGRIILDTDAPAGVVSALTDLPGAAAAQRQAVSRILIRRTTTTDTAYTRRDDTTPFFGGGGIQSGPTTCSSGYTVMFRLVKYMITAGHCYPRSTPVTTESGANVYGTVTNQLLPTTTGHSVDISIIGGAAYGGSIFSGDANSSSSIPVTSAGSASVGFADYCYSGRTTGEQCGHTSTSVNGQVCTDTGCKSPVIIFTGGVLPAVGDSGAPFYARDGRGAAIRGHIIAVNDMKGYVEPWPTLARVLSVTIVSEQPPPGETRAVPRSRGGPASAARILPTLHQPVTT